jgi:hypothetical protein
VINNDLNLAVFRYYNGIGQGTELAINCSAGNEPSCTDIPNIRRIDITLAVETDEVDPASKRRKQMIYSTSVLVRNHGLARGTENEDGKAENSGFALVRRCLPSGS